MTDEQLLIKIITENFYWDKEFKAIDWIWDERWEMKEADPELYTSIVNFIKKHNLTKPVA